MTIDPAATVAARLSQPVAPGDPAAGWRAVGRLYHAYFTGLILTVASQRGARDAGRWAERVFTLQHHRKFLSSFEKLALTGLSDAVACAQYHYLSNAIGGVEVEYMWENPRKAWIRFRHPRWIYAGAAICGVPIEVGHGFIHGWYGRNGVSLDNPRLGFVCTSQDVTQQYGFAGYFEEYDTPFGDRPRVRFAPDEIAPPFDPAAAPRLDLDQWPTARLLKANRNYAMDYLTSSYQALIDCFGVDEAIRLARRNGQLIGRQFYPEVRGGLGVDSTDRDGPDLDGFATFLAAFASAAGDQVTVTRTGDTLTLRQEGWRLMRDGDTDRIAAGRMWDGLIAGFLATHDRFLSLRSEITDDAFTWRVTPAG